MAPTDVSMPDRTGGPAPDPVPPASRRAPRPGAPAATSSARSSPEPSRPRQATAIHALSGLRAEALQDGGLARKFAPADETVDAWVVHAGPGMGWEETAGTPVAVPTVADAATPRAPAPPAVMATAATAGEAADDEASVDGWDGSGRVRTSRQQIGLLIVGVAFAFVTVVAGSAYLAWTPPPPPAPPPASAAPATVRPAAPPSSAPVPSSAPASVAPTAPTASASAPAGASTSPASSAPSSVSSTPPASTSAGSAPTERGLGWPTSSSYSGATAPGAANAGGEAGRSEASAADASTRVGATAVSGTLKVRLEEGFGGGRLVYKCLTGSASHELAGTAVEVPGLAEGCTARAACRDGQVVATTIVPGTTRAVCGGCTTEQPQPRCRPE